MAANIEGALTSTPSERSQARPTSLAVRSLRALLVGLLGLTALVWVGSAAPAAAVGSSGSKMPSEIPSAITPQVADGTVDAIAQVGSVIVIGGSFTSATSANGLGTKPYLFAINATTGALITAFDPVLNNVVTSLLPGPTSDSVYVGGQFNNLNGTSASRVALVSLSTGEAVSPFRSSGINGRVATMAMAQGQLLIGGTFTAINGSARGGLASISPTSGALTSYLTSPVTEHHNNSGSGAQGPVGVLNMVVNPAGTRLVFNGNFLKVDGYSRAQLAVMNLGASAASLDLNWATTDYAPLCYSWAFDTTMRGLAMSPDGSFFVVTQTGGKNANTLCDTAARWETDATGTTQHPTWSNASGGDTMWGVGISDNAVYVGGHSRWLNNPDGSDTAGQGAVGRAGLAALDIDSGLPLKWNPGRNPRGEAIYTVLPTNAGVWIGYDTDWIGNYAYRRQKIAYFPYAGGANLASKAVPTLPGAVYRGGGTGIDQGNVLYRINTGGAVVSGNDGGPNWNADTSSSSPYRPNSSSAASYSTSVTRDAGLPASTPSAIFGSERYSTNDSPGLKWSFPVTTGAPIQVRLFFANQYDGTSAVGQRVFNVDLDGTRVLNDFDIVSAAGGTRIGIMRSFDVTSDGTVNIDFSHVTENPLVNGIEIIRRDLPAPVATGGLSAIGFDGTTAQAPTAAGDLGINWSTARGAFVVGNQLFYGKADGYLYQRTWTTSTVGAESVVDPYHDPDWDSVSTGSGTSTYQGALPTFYTSELASLSGIFYADSRIYYTLSNSSSLYWRWFSPDSGVVGAVRNVADSSRNWSTTAGMFLSGSSLYVVNKTSGFLQRLDWVNKAPSGSFSTVNSTIDWRARALFIGVQANKLPQATFASSCTELQCSFSSTGSSDPDGTIASYHWSFGDGQTGSGANPAHTYTAGGTYSVTLTVTDNEGGQGTYTATVTLNAAPVADFTPECDLLSCTFTSTAYDPDGTIASYAWDFGDGQTSTTTSPTHVYSTPGTYPVSLTVVDNASASATTTIDVVATAANQAPTASFAVACPTATCTFDGSASDDPDGTVVSYAWDFGDGQTGTGAQPTHAYAAAGSYQVRLTVTDDGSATGSTTKTVTVTVPASTPVTHVGSASAAGNGTVATAVVPTVQPGDLMVLQMSANIPGITLVPPSGWTQRGRQESGELDSYIWTKSVSGAMSGSTVMVSLPEITKWASVLVVYRDVDPTTPIAAITSATDASTAQHHAPTATATRAGSRLVQIWTDKSSSTTAWTIPGSLALRATALFGGGGRVTAVVGDAQVDAGQVGGGTATTNAASARGVAWSVVLNPLA
ncbi:MAG: PKD domain-containing protein [Nocardioides sp.]